jgi:hypothetical protein
MRRCNRDTSSPRVQPVLVLVPRSLFLQQPKSGRPMRVADTTYRYHV